MNTRAAHAHTGTHRIDTLIIGLHGNLGAGPRVTGCALDFDQLFTDLRHFNFEQFDQHVRASTAGEQLRAPVLFIHAQQIGTNAIVLANGFTRDHVLAGNQRFSIATEIQNNGIAAGFFHRATDQVADAITVFFNNLTALGFTYLLYDNLLGSLCSDTTKGFGFDFLFPDITDLQRRILLVRFIQSQLLAKFVELLVRHHVPHTEALGIAGHPVNIHTNLYVFLLETFLGGRRECQFNGLEDYVPAYTFLV